MWKWLHPYAKPERAYGLAGTLLPWFAVTSLLAFIIGTVWGLAFAPADYQQGDSFRIIYIHVPSAMIANTSTPAAQPQDSSGSGCCSLCTPS